MEPSDTAPSPTSAQPTGVVGIYKALCPNCGGDWPLPNAASGLLCPNCGRVCERPKALKGYCSFLKEVEAFREFFKRAVGFYPFALQMAWAKRFLLKRSFGIIAPTGIGKSTLGLVLALYAGRALILLPTVLLVEQSVERLRTMAERLGLDVSVKPLHGKVKDKTPEGDIIVTTTAYFARHYRELPREPPYIFVDDVDAFLKASKNVERVLWLMGYSERDIERAYRLLKRQLKGEKVKWSFPKPKTVLVFSSATAKPRGIKPYLLYYLLGFAVGKSSTTLRNIEDFYTDWDEELFFSVAERLRDGILVFVSSAYGREGAERLAQALQERGIEALPYTKVGKEELEAFRQGRLKALVGIASYRNPLARGIDIPERAKYALFYGVPRITFTLKGDLPLGGVRALLAAIYKVARDPKALALLRRLKQAPQKGLEEARAYLQQALTEELIRKINEAEDVSITFTEEGILITVGDVAGYLQASGRTSRMYAGGILKGVALLFVDHPKAFNSLRKRLRWFKEGETFKPYGEEFWRVVAEVEEERAKMGEKAKKEKVEVAMAVVESPNKVRTIAKLFSDAPVRRKIASLTFAEFSIGSKVILLSATVGHLFDLVTKEGWHGILWGKVPVPIYTTIKRCGEKQFTDELECEEAEDKAEIVESLREASWEVDRAYLMTDPDTEGEKIAYDVYAQLRPFLSLLARGEMHAITRREFLNALSQPREVKEELVKAQQVRRIADRIVGFELSKRAQEHFGRRSYSIGRVQTPVLGWVIERWRESKERVKAYFLRVGQHMVRFEGTPSGEVRITFEEVEHPPPPPFTTDELLREANRLLRFSAPQAMEVAQSLFEKGLITYHRTDYRYVSPEGRALAKEWLSQHGLPYQPRAWGEEGAHEAIRPTKPFSKDELVELIHNGVVEPLSKDELALYDIIFRRFMASQMPPAVLREAVATAGEARATFFTEVVEEGYLVLWRNVKLIPLGEMEVVERMVRKALPYTQGELVALMKERGIGRPSTYATIVSILLKRAYVKERGGRLIPTRKGIALYNFARERFGFFVSESFTRELEELMDKVERGEVDYGEALNYIKAQLDRALEGSL